MRLLITGGTGFIGSRLALESRRRGMDVVVTGQLNSPAERARHDELRKAGVVVELADLKIPAVAEQLTSGRDAVIHLAAAQHEANVPDQYFHDINVTGTRTLLQASHAAGVHRFVYGSTIGVYGSAANGTLEETTTPNPVNVYGRTKLEAETVARSFADRLEIAVVRISETYGPGDFRLLKLFRAINRHRFFMIGSGTNLRQVIHVEDLNRLLLLAAEAPSAVGETFVAAGSEVMTTREMVAGIASGLGTRAPALRVPMWPLLMAATILEHTLSPLGIQPPLHRRRLDFFRKSFVFSTDKARKILGFSPAVRFSEGARETAAWYRLNGLLEP